MQPLHSPLLNSETIFFCYLAAVKTTVVKILKQQRSFIKHGVLHLNKYAKILKVLQALKDNVSVNHFCSLVLGKNLLKIITVFATGK